jgi:hypothetical protein
MTPPHAFVGVSIVEASVSSHDIAPRTGIINNIIPGDNNNIIPPTCSDEEVEAIRVAAREYIKLESASENSRGHGALSESRGSWHTKRHQIIFVSFLPGEARQERDRQPQWALVAVKIHSRIFTWMLKKGEGRGRMCNRFFPELVAVVVG